MKPSNLIANGCESAREEGAKSCGLSREMRNFLQKIHKLSNILFESFLAWRKIFKKI